MQGCEKVNETSLNNPIPHHGFSGTSTPQIGLGMK
nr:MAG TPA: RTX iron-regulated protein FrpC [Caudoviricetes sp.]